LKRNPINRAITFFATFSLFYNFIIPLLFNNGMMECSNVLDHKQPIDFGIQKLIGVMSIFALRQRQRTTRHTSWRVVSAF
jgi:hypothetical protein